MRLEEKKPYKGDMLGKGEVGGAGGEGGGCRHLETGSRSRMLGRETRALAEREPGGRRQGCPPTQSLLS